MSRKKVLMSVSASAIVASAFVATEDVSAASYKVSPGDSLWTIAQAHNLSVADLKKWNLLQHDLIFPNQVLQVMKPVDKGNMNSSIKEVSNEKTDDRKHIVASGETLSGIAFSHDVSIKDLMSLNNLNSTLIFPGNVFSIPEVEEKNPTPSKETSHAIVAGDTLSHLAIKYNMTAQKLADLNNIELSDYIYIGDNLIIDGKASVKVETKPKAEATEQTETVKPEVTEPVEVKPEVPVEAPAETPDEPVEVPVETPEVPVEVPAETPEVPVEVPVETPDEPVEVPAETTDEPVEVPAETTDEPVEDPAETTDEPVEDPAETTDEPVEDPAETPDEPVEVPAPEKPKDEPKIDISNTSTYSVKSGDTLGVIASAYGTTASKIAALNGISTSKVLQIGEKLAVSGEVTTPEAKPKPVVKPKPEPTPEVKPQATPKPEVKPDPKPVVDTSNTSTYSVKSGDTLGVIASAYGTTASKIAALNNISTSTVLHIGDKLTVSGEVTKPKPVVKPKPEPTPEVKPDKAPVADSAPSSSGSTYVVKSGDSLSKIASAYGTTAQKIASLSGISTSKVLNIGDKLTVNGTASSSSSPVVNTSNNSKPEAAPAPTPKPPANSGFSANQLMNSANSVMGTKYVWGGTTKSGGFDCSGFIHWAYNDAGKTMGRTSTDGYYSRSFEISKSELQVGDLVFFSGTYRPGISHMGIYAGNNQFTHAATSTGVTTTSLNNSYWSKHFDSFKRFY